MTTNVTSVFKKPIGGALNYSLDKYKCTRLTIKGECAYDLNFYIFCSRLADISTIKKQKMSNSYWMYLLDWTTCVRAAYTSW